MCRTLGPPHDRARNETVLTAALNELPKFTSRNEIRDVYYRDVYYHGSTTAAGCEEAEVRAEILRDR